MNTPHTGYVAQFVERVAKWQRSLNYDGPWEDTDEPSPTMVRRLARNQAHNPPRTVAPAYKWYYRAIMKEE